MDLAKQQKTKPLFSWTGLLINFPGWFLIIKTLITGINSRVLLNSQNGAFNALTKTNALSEFKTYRNLFYLFYIFAFIFIGIYISIRKLNREPIKESRVSNLTPQLTVSLLLVTFSYAIAALILDFYLIISKLFESL